MPLNSCSSRVQVRDLCSMTILSVQSPAACNVTYIFTCDCEALTGPEAVRRSIDRAFLLQREKAIVTVSCHFKASGVC